MNIAQIDLGFSEYPTPEDWSVNVYVSGCTNYCQNCHNENLSDFDYGERTTSEKLTEAIIQYAKRNLTYAVTFLGGDPLHYNNIDEIIETCKLLKENQYDICIYTGYEIIEIDKPEIFRYINYIKCGRYKPEFGQLSYKSSEKFVLASTNQKFYKLINNNPTLISSNGIIEFGNLQL